MAGKFYEGERIERYRKMLLPKVSYLALGIDMGILENLFRIIAPIQAGLGSRKAINLN